jgi:hypothetical protein
VRVLQTVILQRVEGDMALDQGTVHAPVGTLALGVEGLA